MQGRMRQVCMHSITDCPNPAPALHPRPMHAQAYITSQNTIWIFVAASVVYGVGSALLGQRGSIPFIGDAADQQVR